MFALAVVAFVCAPNAAVALAVLDGDLANAVTTWVSTGAHATYGDDIALWDVSHVREQMEDLLLLCRRACRPDSEKP